MVGQLDNRLFLWNVGRAKRKKTLRFFYPRLACKIHRLGFACRRLLRAKNLFVRQEHQLLAGIFGRQLYVPPRPYVKR